MKKVAIVYPAIVTVSTLRRPSLSAKPSKVNEKSDPAVIRAATKPAAPRLMSNSSLIKGMARP